MAKLTDIEGIGDKYAEQLKAIEIDSIEELLSQGATPSKRATIEEKTGISHKLILRWVNHADLFRIHGIGSEYAELLEAAGVDTVPELAQRNPENLHERMTAKNEERPLVRRLPSAGEVAKWVEEAKQLPRIVTY